MYHDRKILFMYIRYLEEIVFSFTNCHSSNYLYTQFLVENLDKILEGS